jgi:CheY-like chemotaxis protein
MVAPKRILLVEDDPQDVELTLNALVECNLEQEVVVARDGAEALDFIYRQNAYQSRPEGNPAVIFLDIKMPKLNGIQVLQKIKSDDKLRPVPVVMLTSSMDTGDLDECYHLGANAYVVKPVRFADFIEAVKQLGKFWTSVNEPPSGSIRKK